MVMNTMLLSFWSEMGFEEWLLIISSILILPAIIFALVAQARVHSAFGRFSQEMSMSGETGATVARKLLDENGCSHVKIELTHGRLSDHYDPRTKVVRLSHDVHNSSSLAALGVAAHEVGHAIQDHTGYIPLKLRQLVIRTTRLVNVALMPLIILGFLGFFLFPLLISESFFFWFIIAMAITYGLSALINLITLPTEYDASRRAKRMLDESNILHDEDERDAVRRVLGAAALTYVASLVVSLVFFLRFLALALMANRRR